MKAMIISFVCVLTFATQSLSAQNLTLEVRGIENVTGKLYVAIYNSQETFMKKPLAGFAVEVKDKVVSIPCKGLPAGTYAFSMYQDEKTRPKIWCKPNQELIENGQKTFWLIVGNGAANMNLQLADNVGIILESYTEGVDVPSKIVLEQKHLAAGDQIPVEVAISVEEGYTGSLNIGWSVEYEYTTAFLTGENDRNGSLQKKTVREDAGN